MLHQTVRDALPIRLGDRKYNVDLTRLARSTVDPIRQGFDTQGTPGEQTLNQAGVWKRTRTDWELGAGQREADMIESVPRRFYASTGINPWVKGELSLLNATTSAKAITNTNQYMAVATVGSTDYVYVANGSDVEYSTDAGATWAGSPISNPASGVVLGVASDGTNIYVAGVGGKVQKIAGTTVGSSTGNEWSMGGMAATDGIWVANGYLIASDGPRLTVLPMDADEGTSNDITSATFSQVDTWSSVIGTPTGIYAAGNKGNKGRIYHIGVSDSTGSLRSPVIAAELPHGETVNALSEYSGVLCIGTSLGLRLAEMALTIRNTFGGSSAGYITYGPRIDIDTGVQAFDGQGEFIWFGWGNYDSPFDTTSRSGLGRLSLRELVAPLTPAYASDLMVSGQSNAVQSVVSSGSTRLFSISGVGVYRQATTYETVGNIDEGRFRWGTTELKAGVSIDLRHSELAANESVKITITDDAGGSFYTTSELDGSYTSGIKAVQIASQKDPTDYGLTAADLQYVSEVSSVTGEYITPVVTLNGGGSATPTLYRWTVRAVPMPFVAEVIQLPVILSTQTHYEGRDIYQNAYDEYKYLRSLLEDRSLVTFEMGNESRTVHVAGVSYEAGAINKWTDDNTWVEGALTVTVITVQGT